MKVNFKKITVEVSFGKFEDIDVAKLLGNHIHASTHDIGFDDMAREIYYSEGEIEVSQQHAQAIVSLMNSERCTMLAAIKKAIIKHLTEQ